MESDDRNPDAALHVRFQMISVYQPYDSSNALLPDGKPNPNYSGNPVYKDVPHIEITTPGGLNRIVEPVRPEHKARFPKHWAMFEMQQGGGEQLVGTKLSEWGAIPRSRAEELRAMKFYVVEQIAEASDMQVQAMGMDGINLRNRARTFLKASKDTALADKLTAENQRKDEEIRQLREAQQKMEQQLAQLAQAQAEQAVETKRRGRPPKAKTETQPAEA